jgi:hypothetical protein
MQPFIDNEVSMCFNLAMDPFQAYKDKIETRIAQILSDSLSKKIINIDDSDEMATYILENIDLTKTNEDLLAFVENLSAKWPIFNTILASPDQPETPLPAIDQAQEKTDQIVNTAEDLIRENKLDEALQMTKTAMENTIQNPQVKTGGVI